MTEKLLTGTLSLNTTNQPTHTVCKHCWLICYETDMGPEIPTAAADQNFAWICKQHQDLIGSVLSFRTKIIWSGPEFGLVRCGYLNAANIVNFGGFHFESACHYRNRNYRKNLKISDTWKCAVIILKVEQYGFSLVYCSQKMQRELRSSLIWVYTVFPDMSVQKLRNIRVEMTHANFLLL